MQECAQHQECIDLYIFSILILLFDHKNVFNVNVCLESGDGNIGAIQKQFPLTPPVLCAFGLCVYMKTC